MRCNKARRFLGQAMDEQLPPAVTRELDAHLDQCAECRGFRTDLVTGRRLLAATEPDLPESFDWRLQLELSKALQRSAGETAYPWHESGSLRGSWVSPFTTAASMGLAAVLALVMFLSPVVEGPLPVNGTGSPRGDGPQAARDISDRLPLARDSQASPFTFGGSVQRSVSRSAGLARNDARRNFVLEPAWSGNHLEDLMTIQDLRLRNQRLNNQLYQYQRENAVLRARLDRADSNDLDLGE